VSSKKPQRKSPRPHRIADKLLKAAEAKSTLAKVNYGIDALDETIQNPLVDKALHFIDEMTLAGGTPEERFRKWARKARKYR